MDQILPRYACSSVEDVGDFTGLQAEWNALHAASPDGYVSQGFEWAQVCLDAASREGGARLRCFVLRRRGRMAALWPMVVSQGRLWRVAKPLASPNNEYCPLLFDAAADVSAAWEAVRDQLSDVDAVLLTRVRDDSALAPWLRDCPEAAWVRSQPAPFLRSSEFGDWESYHGQLPHKVRSNLSRNWRRVRSLGEVRFEELTDPADARTAWAWMVAQKRAWLVRKSRPSRLTASDDYTRFMDATLAVEGYAGRRRIFVLKLNGQLAAAELVNIDRRRIEMFELAYDPAFGQCAPGNLLRSEVLRWAFARGLDYDWRVGGDAYKSEWANHTCDAADYVLALSIRGRALAAYASGRRWLSERTPDSLRSGIRSLIGYAY
jgi:CelD/BcsL family acetyltransferase involved in cellulose biosynthesis